jgi:hypothetical protein
VSGTPKRQSDSYIYSVGTIKRQEISLIPLMTCHEFGNWKYHMEKRKTILCGFCLIMELQKDGIRIK